MLPLNPPVEGVDYYVENGRWVFTAAYHRRRAYCCRSGCRHCPFDPPPTTDDRATVALPLTPLPVPEA